MAETTTIVMMEEDAENTESEQSRMSIGSASSNSTASTSDSSTKDHWTVSFKLSIQKKLSSLI